MSFLGPQWLVSQIPLIALLIGVIILVVFSDFVNRKIVFPVADFVKSRSHNTLKKSILGTQISKYVSEGFGTIIFLLYCYFGSALLAEYVFSPLLSRAQGFLLIIVLVLFLLLSVMINNANLRKKFLKV